MDLKDTLEISAKGMQAQGVRLRVVAENLANAGSVAPSATEDPYRRKIVTFKNELDRASGVNVVKVGDVGVDKSDFQQKYDPGNPSADANGYVKTSNVNSMVEVMDMREAQNAYEANLGVTEIAKSMMLQTISLLK
jgi:flagellar basal-body rod protein FlgC